MNALGLGIMNFWQNMDESATIFKIQGHIKLLFVWSFSNFKIIYEMGLKMI